MHVYVRGELPYIPLLPYSDKECSTLPHVMLTLDVDWDPTFIECEGLGLGLGFCLLCLL